MDDEIDLRQQVALLLRHWKLILLLTVLAGSAAAAYSYSLPDTYEATALVSVSPPRSTLRLEGVNQATTLPVLAYPELAKSGDVLAEVYARVQDQLPPTTDTLERFSRALSAEAASDNTLLRLSVRDTDPARAAAIANAWVEVFAARAGQLYGQDQAALAIYEQQLAAARAELDRADAELAAYQASNQVNVLRAQLASLQASLTDYLNRRHQLDLVQQDLDDLRARLGGLAGEAPASLAEDLALLSLVNRLYGSQGILIGAGQGASPSAALQVQIGTDRPLAGPTAADQLALADNLLATLATRREQIEGQIADLEPEILRLQGLAAAAAAQEQQLTRARDLASSQYLSLTGQVQDAQVAAQAWANIIQVASRAQAPTEKAGPRRALTTLAAAVLGLGLGVALVLGTQLLPAEPPAAARAGAARVPNGRAEPAGEASEGRAAQPAHGADKPS
ncbi:MAG: hypothetical protein IT318_03415 [Anaerolineales bacterium]|nr:hypothetical protein [Anaerolineales bacterium]